MNLRLEVIMFWVSKQRLVDQANTICRNGWMPDSEIEEMERNLAKNGSYKKEERGSNFDSIESI